MPSIEQNRQAWNVDYPWEEGGDEWSQAWGSPAMQWYGTILPRIQRCVSTDSILEIACGFGRWTWYLKDLCQRLVAVDLSAKCVAASRQRFAADSHVEIQLNDGASLDCVADESINFVFSCDSLVHADSAVLSGYLSEIPRVLRKDGFAFLHHSNLGAYAPIHTACRLVPELRDVLQQLDILDDSVHWRDLEVSAPLIEALAEDHGLRCISQELVPWGTKQLQIDCFSMIVRADGPFVRANRILRNVDFMRDANKLRQLGELYAE